MAFLQWNCRGLRSNFAEFKVLLSDTNPEAFCLQETFISNENQVKIRGYQLIHSLAITNGEGRSSGGICIGLKNGIIHRQINLSTNLNAVAVSVTSHKTITLCCVYLPPSHNINPADLDNLINQLPTPFLILGDFNAHNTLWGGQTNDRRGTIIENLILRHNLCLYNDKTPTYLHPATGTQTSIDLSLSHPQIFTDYIWTVIDDLYGSDHHPIRLNLNLASSPSNVPRWNLAKADWAKFNHLCNQQITMNKFINVTEKVSMFTKIMTNIANDCIPKSLNRSKQKCVWFNNDCRQAVSQRKQALARLKRQPTTVNLDNFKLQRAKARRVFRQSKRESWRNYVSNINANTNINKVWKMVNKIKGKHNVGQIQQLKENGQFITDTKNISNRLAAAFEKNSSTGNYNPLFQKFKEKTEKTFLNFNSDNSEFYNQDLMMQELDNSLSNSHDTAVGPDEIHYQMLKHLPKSCKEVLLHIFNHIWTTGDFPESWRNATVIPLAKPGKDASDAKNYRPIALTSCLCKTMERMVNDRLTWHLESNGFITAYQSGFRKGRSTLDQLIRLETYVRDAFIKRQHVVAIFFDLEKAYDTTWKYGIMKDLHDIDMRGRLPVFIQQFLTNRQFKVRIGSVMSDTHSQEMGVPQGSVLSVTLFSLKINSIVQNLLPDVQCSLYVDDFVIYLRAAYMPTIERRLQLILNKLYSWSNKNGFKFSTSKTACVHFCNKRKMHGDPNLFLNGQAIPVVPQYKFLGVIFDSKLNFIQHLRSLKDKCMKALNLIKVIAHTDWGADRATLLKLYRSLVRSKLDYGCTVYGSARKSYLKMLDPIHNQGLRLCLGAFRTSPVQSLYADANEPSLYDRRIKLALQYTLKLKSNIQNPTYEDVFQPKNVAIYQKRPTAIPPFSLRTEIHLDNLGFNIYNIAAYKRQQYPPWCITPATIDWSMQSGKKSSTDPSIYLSKFVDLRLKYHDHIFIYTDGSKDGPRSGAAATSAHWQSKYRLPDHSSIFSAELTAIALALVQISSRSESCWVIASDSKSALQAIHNNKWQNPFVSQVASKLHALNSTGKTIILTWVPSHMGIRGNDQADTLAKLALNDPIFNIKVPWSDFKPLINNYLYKTWQESWNSQDSNKLKQVKPTIGNNLPCNLPIRKDEVILCRTRIGHTRATHEYLLKGEAQPMCPHCNTPLTVKHIILYCGHLNYARNKFIFNIDFKDLFNLNNYKSLLKFLKFTGFYNKF